MKLPFAATSTDTGITTLSNPWRTPERQAHRHLHVESKTDMQITSLQREARLTDADGTLRVRRRAGRGGTGVWDWQMHTTLYKTDNQQSLPRWGSGREPSCPCRRHKRKSCDPWVWKIPWRRNWQPTPVFLSGEFHGQRSLMGYSPWAHKRV